MQGQAVEAVEADLNLVMLIILPHVLLAGITVHMVVSWLVQPAAV